ncbi:MAG: hypothetical protein ACI8W8_001510, partial [Rhodothermales bacterium]
AVVSLHVDELGFAGAKNPTHVHHLPRCFTS